jgi:hypothetical protein
MESTWSNDIESVLENIRINSVVFNAEHKKRYVYLKGFLRYFKIPTIVLSGINSVISVGLQPYLQQGLISACTCIVSLIITIIGSIELYLSIQTQMENELTTSKEFYLLSIDIFKMLSLERNHRTIEGKTFLEDKFGIYEKLIEQSNVVNKKIQDKLAPLPPLIAVGTTDGGSDNSL